MLYFVLDNHYQYIIGKNNKALEENQVVVFIARCYGGKESDTILEIRRFELVILPPISIAFW